MVAKRSNRALALLLALPSAAFALGLGDIRLLSPLNAPLDAEVELVAVPPVYTPGQSAVASAPVTAPATGVGTREGAIARSADAPPVAAPAAPQPDPPAEAAPAAPRGAPPASSDSSVGSMHVVQRGETLTAIASDAAGASANSARTHSWMLAIYRANPRAFDRNMNVMRSGAVMRIPD